MKVRVIGGSNAFDYDNSSFLIEHNGKQLLFDCGLNAFQYIKENNLDITDVFISHTHFDHISGLEALIFYNYFVKGKITTIYRSSLVDVEKFLPAPILYDNGQTRKTKMYEVKELVRISDLFGSKIKAEPVYGNHIVTMNVGLGLYDTQNRKALIITGDTKASSSIRDLLLENLKYDYDITLFHDFNPNGRASTCIHCCPEDYDVYYKDLEDKIKIYKYHNTEFNEKYKGKTIEI